MYNKLALQIKMQYNLKIYYIHSTLFSQLWLLIMICLGWRISGQSCSHIEGKKMRVILPLLSHYTFQWAQQANTNPTKPNSSPLLRPTNSRYTLLISPGGHADSDDVDLYLVPGFRRSRRRRELKRWSSGASCGTWTPTRR